MAVAQTQYQSDYGWTMNIPANWMLLPTSRGPALTTHRPVVFCSDENSDLWLTWMVAAHPIDEKIALDFVSATQAQQPSHTDLIAVAPGVFPVIGKIDSCEVVHLLDGSRAIELFESYTESNEIKRAYQLIMQLNKDFTNTPPVFQRICFYAPSSDFDKHIREVRACARSFYYTRNYGWRQAN